MQTSQTDNDKRDCKCSECVDACKAQPGWFKYGEAEKAASLYGLPFKEFREKFLILDHCDNPYINDAPYVWAPRKVDVDGKDDRIRSFENQRKEGKCIFLQRNRCSIHEAKPFECREALPCENTPNHRYEVEQTYMRETYPLGRRPR